MKWLLILLVAFSITSIQITAVQPFADDSGATVTMDNGGTLQVFGAAPHVGPAEVEYSDCFLWLFCRKATITQDGIPYPATP